MYKRLGIAMLGIATAATIGACSPSIYPSDQPPGAEQRPTTLQNPPKPVKLGEGAMSSGAASQSATAGNTCEADDITVDGSYGTKPEITIPRDCAEPVSALQRDLQQGSGPGAGSGSTLKVRYQKVSFADGEVVDGNFGAGEPLAVRDLGNSGVGNSGALAGIGADLVGMRQGGRRLVVVPPDTAQGGSDEASSSTQASSGHGKTFVYVVDAVAVQPA